MKTIYKQIKLPLLGTFEQRFSFVDLFAGIGVFRIVTKIKSLPSNIDILVGGVPCQVGCRVS